MLTREDKLYILRTFWENFISGLFVVFEKIEFLFGKISANKFQKNNSGTQPAITESLVKWRLMVQET